MGRHRAKRNAPPFGSAFPESHQSIDITTKKDGTDSDGSFMVARKEANPPKRQFYACLYKLDRIEIQLDRFLIR